MNGIVRYIYMYISDSCISIDAFVYRILIPAHWPSGRVFANGLGDLGSILCRVIPKTFKMIFDTSLLRAQQYKIRIKGKVEQSREKSSALSYISV